MRDVPGFVFGLGLLIFGMGGCFGPTWIWFGKYVQRQQEQGVREELLRTGFRTEGTVVFSGQVQQPDGRWHFQVAIAVESPNSEEPLTLYRRTVRTMDYIPGEKVDVWANERTFRLARDFEPKPPASVRDYLWMAIPATSGFILVLMFRANARANRRLREQGEHGERPSVGQLFSIGAASIGRRFKKRSGSNPDGE